MAVGRSQWKREWWWRLSSERCDEVESRSEHSAQQLSSVDTGESGRVSRDCSALGKRAWPRAWGVAVPKDTETFQRWNQVDVRGGS